MRSCSNPRPAASPGKDTGPGRLPDPVEIAELARLLLERPTALPRDLDGRRVVVSAGGTREALDPVRFLGNRSSGRQGYALARVAAQRGAQVTLVAAHTADLGDPAAVEVVRVGSALQLRDAMHAAAKGADAIVMTAAVADFRPAALAAHKIKKSGSHDPPPLPLTQNPDVLVELVAAREPGQVIVGFAAETGDEAGDALHHGRAKLARKGCDLLVVNAVGDGHGVRGGRQRRVAPRRRRQRDRARHRVEGVARVTGVGRRGRPALNGGQRRGGRDVPAPPPPSAEQRADRAARRPLADVVGDVSASSSVGRGHLVGRSRRGRGVRVVLVVGAVGRERWLRRRVVVGDDAPPPRPGARPSTDTYSCAAQPSRSVSWTKPSSDLADLHRLARARRPPRSAR